MSRIGMIHELHALRKDVDELKRAMLRIEALDKTCADAFALVHQRLCELEAKRTPGRPKKDE